VGCRNGYGTCIRELLVDEERNERQLFFLCPLGGLDKLLLGDNAILHKSPGQTCQTGL
jgi:hypothetical protein